MTQQQRNRPEAATGSEPVRAASRADQAAVEVRVVLPDGSQRGCFFMTPAALSNAGDRVAGTRVRMRWGGTHMLVVAECSEATIRAVLDEVARAS